MGKIEIKIQDGIKLAAVKGLFGWKDNPKDLESPDYKRLIEQIKLGEHSALLITPDGEVLGGNTRLRAYKKTGKEYAKVIVVDIKKEGENYTAYVDGVKADREFDTPEQAKLEYALSHNDMVGNYNETKLAELLHVHAIPMEVYKVSTIIRPVEDIAFEAGPAGNLEDREEDKDTTGTEKLDAYMNGSIKQIVLYFDNDAYERIIPRIEALRERFSVDNNTDLFIAMVEECEANG